MGCAGDYVDLANQEVCLLLQAESTMALDHLEAICAVDGVDGVFIGPSDLAASMGYRGQLTHPTVQAQIDLAIRRITASGKAAGILTADLALAQRYLELGATFVAVGIEANVLSQGVRGLAQSFGRG